MMEEFQSAIGLVTPLNDERGAFKPCHIAWVGKRQAAQLVQDAEGPL